MSINLRLENIFQSWFAYRKGKRTTQSLDFFQFYLEKELTGLWFDLNNSTYKHGNYTKFIVSDNKTRHISVASIRDRVVHRLIYDYLVNIYDKTFIYDVWSCRKGKGLTGAITRTQKYMKKYSGGFVWRADVSKFFDNVDHTILLKILSRKITDKKTIKLLSEIINGFSLDGDTSIGIPIGNLTSQIFSNIYLNEFDRFVKHTLKVKDYLRYGDDFTIFAQNREELENIQIQATHFLTNELKLSLHKKNNVTVKTKHGLKFLGIVLYPKGRKLSKRNNKRLFARLNTRNAGSYYGLLTQHTNAKQMKKFQWILMDKTHIDFSDL